jgi:hypothetical protein
MVDQSLIDIVHGLTPKEPESAREFVEYLESSEPIGDPFCADGGSVDDAMAIHSKLINKFGGAWNSRLGRSRIGARKTAVGWPTDLDRSGGSFSGSAGFCLLYESGSMRVGKLDKRLRLHAETVTYGLLSNQISSPICGGPLPDGSRSGAIAQIEWSHLAIILSRGE